MAQTHTAHPHHSGPTILVLVIALAVIAALALAMHRPAPAAMQGDDLGNLLRAFVHQVLPEPPLPSPRPQVAGHADAAG